MLQKNKVPKKFIYNPVHFLALGFGSGLSPIAPGTCGTLVAVLLYLLLGLLPQIYYLLLLIPIIVVGIWVCGISSRDLHHFDHPSVVWDEFVGFFVTMIAVPYNWVWIITGFISFRFFDILKPWPIRNFERRFRGGIGIVGDDILAAIYAQIVLQCIIFMYR